MHTHSPAGHHEDGQIMILAAILLGVIMLACAFAVDGGFGLFQSRQAQNAADFAALAASNLTPCNDGNTSVTGSQEQQTVQTVVDDNYGPSGTTVSWTANYLDGSGNPISGATFSNSTTFTPPSNACGVSVNVSGTWNTSLAQLGGINTATTTRSAGGLGSGPEEESLAIAQLLPWGHHVLYSGAAGNFVVKGDMMSNSVGNTAPPSSCLTGTPLATKGCYTDSVDSFQSSSVSISGTLFSSSPVPLDGCFAPAPATGEATCNHTTQGISYGAIQGNVPPLADPLASLPDPSANGGAATECPGQSGVTTYSTGVVASGSLNPGVYTNTVTITGNVTLNPCQANGSTTAPGIYVFQQGLEICPAASDTVSGSDVMLYTQNAPSSTYSNHSGSTSGYCVAAPGAGTTVLDALTVGGLSGSTVSITAPDSGIYKGVALYQDRSITENIGFDDGWTTTGSGKNATTTPDDAAITVNGVVYDNSLANEQQNQRFGNVVTSSLCTGADNKPGGPCPGLTPGLSFTSTLGTVNVNGAVIVGAFGTGGNTAVTLTFAGAKIPISGGNLRLVS